MRRAFAVLVSALVLMFSIVGLGQEAAQNSMTERSENLLSDSSPHVEQVAKILGITELLSNARRVNQERTCGAPVSIEELSMRQDILETAIATSLEVDGVLAELENERDHLSELNSVLQGRRDHTVNLLSAANLVTGTGLGIAVNAMQFSSTTANVGNGLGVASGIGSTVLSIIGIRAQGGPVVGVGRIPNMLAPLFRRPAALNAYYPPEIMDYLKSVPPGQSESSGTRLDQLMSEWQQAGRIGNQGQPKTEKKIAMLTSSLDKKTKLSIDDINDRIAMLADVTGRVGLMKRDLAELMLSLRKKGCGGK